MHRLGVVTIVVMLLVPAGCAGPSDSRSSPEFALVISPPLVNRVIPGVRPLTMIEISGRVDGPVE